MKIDKAIEILTIHNDHNPNFTDAERREAHQLGIEALKRFKCWRPIDPFPGFNLLPGETDKKITKEELEKLEEEGYSCGDCSHIGTCKNSGKNKFSFICYEFDRGD